MSRPAPAASAPIGVPALNTRGTAATPVGMARKGIGHQENRATIPNSATFAYAAASARVSRIKRRDIASISARCAVSHEAGAKDKELPCIVNGPAQTVATMASCTDATTCPTGCSIRLEYTIADYK